MGDHGRSDSSPSWRLLEFCRNLFPFPISWLWEWHRITSTDWLFFWVLLAANPPKKNNEKLHEALFLHSFRCVCCQPQCFRDLQSETGTRKELAERASIFRQRFVIGSFESFTLLWMSALFIFKVRITVNAYQGKIGACWHWRFLSSLWWSCITCRGIDLAGLATFPSKKMSICLKSVQQGLLENARAKRIRCRRAEVLQRQGSFHCCWSAPCLAYRCCRNDIDTMLNKKHAAQFPTAARVSTSPIFNNIYSVAMRGGVWRIAPGKAYPQLGSGRIRLRRSHHC